MRKKKINLFSFVHIHNVKDKFILVFRNSGKREKKQLNFN